MADSDDEFDRRRRDKFRRERGDMERSREREERRREDWPDREWDRSRDRRRDYDRGHRDRFSPPRHISPQHKRMRTDWDDSRGAEPYRFDLPFGGGMAPFLGAGPQGWHPDLPHLHPQGGLPLQARLGAVDPDLRPPGPPTMRTFKEFLLNMEDSVDETEAVKRYNQYKVEFRRQQLQDFFLQHREQQWFRLKYHPDDIIARRAESLAALKTRLSVFLFLLDNDWLDKASLDMDHAPAIIKLMDAAVIKMEGGTDFDLQVLEVPTVPLVTSAEGGGAKNQDDPSGESGDPQSVSEPPETEETPAGGEGGETKELDMVDVSVQQNGKKDKEQDEEDKKKEEEDEEEKMTKKGQDSVSADSGEGSASDSDSSHSSGEKEEEDDCDRERRVERPKQREGAVPVKPRPLHLTASLFIRSLPPDVSKEQIAVLCKRYPGFLRVALSDPQPERRFFRRCWVTFDRSVNIKETCWNLQNVRLKECELSPVVNRDLSRRVRSVNGLTHHRPVVRNDIRLSTRLIHSLDHKGELWPQQEESNPVLRNITDYLIEEVSAEEEELTGGGASEDPASSSEVAVETDDKLLKVLDRLLLYLRLVHSVDYYNFSEYPAEDEMPHRCGLIHVRGPLPVAKVTAAEVAEHQRMCEERLSPLMTPADALKDDEAVRLGRKDPEQEVEMFLSANTQELSKDKWLCPLSGKKFKAPEFVRKHILNKHADKVAAVRQEVDFFNNFLSDTKRPALPESKPHPPTPQAPPPAAQPPQQQSLLGYPPGVRPLMPAFPGATPPYPPNQFGAGRGNYDNFRGGVFPGKQRNSRGMRGDPRSIIEYRDLDAPEDLDFF